MSFASSAKARQLHADQVGQREAPQAFHFLTGGEFRSGLWALRAHLLAGEDQGNCPPGGFPGLSQQADSRRVAVLQSERLYGLRRSEYLRGRWRYRCPSQASGVRLPAFHLEISRQAASDPIREAGRGEGLLHASYQVEELIPALLEERY